MLAEAEALLRDSSTDTLGTGHDRANVDGEPDGLSASSSSSSFTRQHHRLSDNADDLERQRTERLNAAFDGYARYVRKAQAHCRKIWATFDLVMICAGTTAFFFFCPRVRCMTAAFHSHSSVVRLLRTICVFS